jgi:uncharacterized protein YjbI with pentapeptide repeats
LVEVHGSAGVEQNTTIWKRVWTIGGVTLVVVVLAIIMIVAFGYVGKWQWTGLPATVKDGPKTLWDWFDLLIIPLVLAVGAWWFRKGEEDLARMSRKSEADSARKLEEQRTQENALEAYLDKMSELLLDKDHPLRDSDPGDPSRDLAKTRTLTVLRRLDVDGRNHVLQFLRDADLLGQGKEPEPSTGNKSATASEKLKKKTIALLEKAKMYRMDLTAANLWRANLTGAKLTEANLAHADLKDANLAGARLTRANLTRAYLADANLTGAFLTGAFLTRAHLAEANLRYTNLRAADLSGANLGGADLSGANLIKANLTGARLTGANLGGADLSEAKLSGAKLSGADLTETDLSEVNGLTCEQVQSAVGKPRALPDYIPESCKPKPHPLEENDTEDPD